MEFQGVERTKNYSFSNNLRVRLPMVFSMRFFVYQHVCPSDDLTLPQKEMLMFAMKMASFVVLFLLVLFNKLIKTVSFCIQKTPELINGISMVSMSDIDIESLKS